MLMKRWIVSLLLASVAGLTSCGDSEPESTELLVLMYHHLNETGDANVTVTDTKFDEHLTELALAGYETVSPAELIEYVDEGEELPEKPVLIVFDDGYDSNYTMAYPVLEKHNDKAVICVIGWSAGRDTYKDTGYPIIPYFSWEKAKEMEESGLVTIGSHTYDMHQTDWIEPDPANCRISAARLESETPEQYQKVFGDDHAHMCEVMEENLGHKPIIFAYPHGIWEPEAQQILRDSGVRITLITEVGYNTVIQGDSESLHLLKRYNINEATVMSDILSEAAK